MENYPILKQKYVIPNNDNLIHLNFGKYYNWALNYVNNIQIKNFDTGNKSEVPLTFYPIAKNIRTTSSYMAKNILEHKTSFINNNSREGETQFWSNNLNRGNWYPWLWARGRISDNYTNFDGWQFYFDSFTSNHKGIIDNGNDSSKSNNMEIIEPPQNLKLFFIHLACVKYTFQLNIKYITLMNNYKLQMQWPDNSKILAVQIRRGETCTKDGKKTDREFFKLEEYIETIQTMIDNNKYEYIYISTDSNEEIDKIQKIKPNWKLLYLPIDRTKFFRMIDDAPMITNTHAIPQDLEDSCRLYPESIPFIVDSGLADLYFISQCQGYISTISVSEFSRCGWYLQMATQSQLCPYINLNSKPLDMNSRDILLLL